MSAKKYFRIEIKVTQEEKEIIKKMCWEERVTQTALIKKALSLYYKNNYEK